MKKLEELGFSVPPYEIIEFTKDQPVDIKEYLTSKIKKLEIPFETGDRVGVTIRVSMPGNLDKVAKHGGLHITDEEDLIRRIIDRHQRYGSQSKIIIQHTVDARCSGALLKEAEEVILETIPGDAPPLLEGSTTDYEKWVLYKGAKWMKEKNYFSLGKETEVLTAEELYTFSVIVGKIPRFTYLEWSISKNRKLYVYELCILNG